MWAHVIIVAILQMRKQEIRECNPLAQGHTVSKQHGKGVNARDQAFNHYALLQFT